MYFFQNYVFRKRCVRVGCITTSRFTVPHSLSRESGRVGTSQRCRSMSIPKPKFISCDETSLKFGIDYTPAAGTSLKLQYKEPHEAWSAAREVAVPSSLPQVSIAISEVVDLKPGTAYFVRIACFNKASNVVEYGTESVFDTKPIDCTPKRKKCAIS